MPSIRRAEDRARQDDSAERIPTHQRLFPDASRPAEPVAGVRLGHFTIEEQIGRGGMGAVFRAIDQRLNRVVALKVLAPDQSRDPAAVQRFQNEARAAARLDHENIARVYFIGEDQGLQFIAFEFVTGTNIREFLQIRGNLSCEEAVNYALQVALALRHTAAAGVVHRDIKPSNIVVSPTGRVKLVDLGLARTQMNELGEELTVAGTALGTFDYISPEQARDPRQVDVRSDIYSLGCTLYHMLTGEPPFPKGTMFEKVIEHHGSHPPDPALKNPRVSPQLARVVQKMMASLPDQRYPTPDALIQDLVAVAHVMGLRPSAPETPVWMTPLFQQLSFWEQNRGWVMTVAILVAIVLFIDRFQWTQGDRNNASGSVAQSNPSMIDPAQGSSLQQGTGSSSRGAISPREVQLSSPGSTGSEPSPLDNVSESYELSRIMEGLIREDETFSASVAQMDNDSEGLPGRLSNAPSGLGQGLSSGRLEALQGSSLVTAPGRPGEPERSPVVARDANPPSTSSGGTSVTVPEITPAAQVDNPFTVIGPSGTLVGSYPTLWSACSAAPDNSLIEVSSSGTAPLRERPIRIVQKRLRIQARNGRRLVIEFTPGETASFSAAWNCIEVIEGSLILSDLDLVVRVPNGTATTMFSLSRARELTLNRVTLTLVNPTRLPAQFIEFPSPTSAERMEMMAADIPRIDVSSSLIRGSGDFLVNRSETAFDARFQQTAIACSQSLLTLQGMDIPRMNQPSEGAVCRMEFEHCTCIVGVSLMRLEAPMESNTPRARFDMVDCLIWSTSGSSPLISMTGGKELDELIRLLDWRGFGNYVHVTGPWWMIDAPFSTVGTFESWDDREWRSHWPNSDDRSLPVSLLPGGSIRVWSEVQPSQWMLRFSEEPVTLMASDGRLPGVDWSSESLPNVPRID